MTKPKEKAIEYLRDEGLLSSNLKYNETLFKAIDIALKEQQKEIDDLMESIKNVLEAVDESKKVDALFELKNLYKAKLKRKK